MLSNLSKLSGYLLIAVLLSGGLISLARAADLSVSPAAFSYDLLAGQQQEVTLTVTNNGSVAERLQFSIGGNPTNQITVPDWIRIISNNEVTIEPVTSSEVKLSIEIAGNAQTGNYRLVLLTTPDSVQADDGATVVNRIGTNLDLNVLGQDEAGAKWQSGAAQLEIIQVQYGHRWWPGPLPVAVTLRNNGPWRGIPHGTVRLTRRTGRSWQVPINTNRQPLLPGQTATYDLSLPVSYQTGPYYDEVMATLMTETPALATHKIWLFPWFGPIILIIGLIIFRQSIRRRARR